MKFEQIVERLNPFLLHERYYNYTFPEKKSLQMYDFYVLDYLRYLVENMSPQNFRDLPMDLEDSVKDSVNKLFPALRQELLNAVFYAVCAEMRHSDGSNGGNKSHRQLFTGGTKDAKIYNAYLKYMLYHKANDNEKQELVDIHGAEKPRTREFFKSSSPP